MAQLEELIDRFYLRSNPFKTKTNIAESWGDLLIQKKFWEKIHDSSLDTGELKNFFAEKTDAEREEYLQFAIACFMYFIQYNYTGPTTSVKVEEFLNTDLFKEVDFSNHLSMNNEEVDVNVKHPALLVISEIIFEHCIFHDLINAWWYFRAIVIHQDVLDELNTTLLPKATILDDLIKKFDLEDRVKAEIELEIGQMYLKFLNVGKCKTHLDSVKNILGVEYKFQGKLGKRTKFQTRDLPQLTLEVTLDPLKLHKHKINEDVILPQSFLLNDEDLLEHVAFRTEPKIITLASTEQKLILLEIQYVLRATPAGELDLAGIFPFVDLLLKQANTYATRVAILLIRCKLECRTRKTIDRSLKQYENLVDFFEDSRYNTNPTAENRMMDFFGTAFPPIWKLKAEYAETLLNIGLVKNSLDIYLGIQLWEEVIVCYSLLQLKQKAAEVIQKQLKFKPTVKMMCLLGDVTEDVSCYEKAWEMSKEKSHRAQRHWGQYFYTRKDYTQCIPHFEKSVDINSLQPQVWHKIGYAALQIEDWKKAAYAYRRYTSLEPESFQAWNNIAQAYLKLGNMPGAYQAILEAIKCNFENWKVWENLLLISHDVKKTSDIIRAYHKLIDLKEKYLNIGILRSLVSSIGRNEESDADGKPMRNYLQKSRELLGRLTSIDPNNGDLWELYARLAPTEFVRAQRFQRAYGGYSKRPWGTSPESCLQVLNVCHGLGKAVLDKEVENNGSFINSAKLNISAALTVARKQNWEEYPEIQQRIKDVATQLEAVMEKIQSVKADTENMV